MQHTKHCTLRWRFFVENVQMAKLVWNNVFQEDESASPATSTVNIDASAASGPLAPPVPFLSQLSDVYVENSTDYPSMMTMMPPPPPGAELGGVSSSVTFEWSSGFSDESISQEDTAQETQHVSQSSGGEYRDTSNYLDYESMLNEALSRLC